MAAGQLGKCRPQSQKPARHKCGEGNAGGGRLAEAEYIGYRRSGNTRDNDTTNADPETQRGNEGKGYAHLANIHLQLQTRCDKNAIPTIKLGLV